MNLPFNFRGGGGGGRSCLHGSISEACFERKSCKNSIHVRWNEWLKYDCFVHAESNYKRWARPVF